jgi:hypothetical protein
VSEFEGGILAALAADVLVGAGVRIAPVVVATRATGGRVVDDESKLLGFGVMLLSAEGSRLLVVRVGRGVARGVLSRESLPIGAERSDIGGEGGSCTSETVSAVATDFESGGVVINGELAVERGELLNMGDDCIERSVEMAER